MMHTLRLVLEELLFVLQLTRSLLWFLTVRPPGFGKRTQLSEESDLMGQVFTYRQELLPVKPGVSGQRLTVTVDGVSQEPQSLGADATSADFKAGPTGASVELRLDYLDAAGNDSDDVTTTFVVVDGIPPAAPEGFGTITQIAEETVE